MEQLTAYSGHTGTQHGTLSHDAQQINRDRCRVQSTAPSRTTTIRQRRTVRVSSSICATDGGRDRERTIVVRRKRCDSQPGRRRCYYYCCLRSVAESSADQQNTHTHARTRMTDGNDS